MKLISSFWTVIIISVAVSVIFLSYGFFHEFRPVSTQASYDNDFAQKLEDEGAKMPQATARKRKAIEIVKQKSSDWNVYVATRTPAASVRQGGIDISVNPYQLSMDTWTFRNSIQRAVNAQIKMGGTKLIGDGPTIPAPTDVNNVGGLLSDYYHYPGIKFPVLIFDLGQIQVQGTYQQIMDNVESYKTMPNYLAMADGLHLEGTGSILTGTYNLTLVAFIRGDKVYGSIPEAASATTGSSFGGRGFGGPGGVSGGRPGMSRGLSGMPGMAKGLGSRG
jgi:hypothetical protein